MRRRLTPSSRRAGLTVVEEPGDISPWDILFLRGAICTNGHDHSITPPGFGGLLAFVADDCELYIWSPHGLTAVTGGDFTISKAFRCPLACQS